MHIESMTLQNFRCYEWAEFKFGEVTTVYGHNGAGKSTLAEAVVWCLFGTNILGKSKQDETLMRLGAKDMAVVVTFVKDGKQLVFARARESRKGSALTLNGMKPKLGQVEGIFGSVSEFLSIFLPGYFSSLEPKEAKAVLTRCVPDVDKQDVLARIPDPEIAEVLAHDQFAMGIDSMDYAAKKLRGEIAELENELLRSEGELNAHRTVLREGPPRPFQSAVTAQEREQYELTKRTLLKAEAQFEQREHRLQELNEERNRLLRKHQAIKANPPKVETTCLTCGQSLPSDKVKVARENAMREHQQRLDEIVAEGQQVRAKMETLQAQSVNAPQLGQLSAELKRVEAQLASEQQAQIEYAAAMQSYQRAEKRTKELEIQLDEDRQTLAELQRKVKALQEFRFEYVRAQHEKLNGLFQNVRIKLVDANRETGEIRESFRITWKGRPYRLLSFSEKVRCDLEIGRVLAFAFGETLPVFIDNAESVQNLFGEPLSGQVIAAFVEATDDPKVAEELREKAADNSGADTLILNNATGQKVA